MFGKVAVRRPRDTCSEVTAARRLMVFRVLAWLGRFLGVSTQVAAAVDRRATTSSSANGTSLTFAKPSAPDRTGSCSSPLPRSNVR